ncbi:MAG: hypothetical protein ACREMY_18460, partial [bacterium]
MSIMQQLRDDRVVIRPRSTTLLRPDLVLTPSFSVWYDDCRLYVIWNASSALLSGVATFLSGRSD